MMEGAIYLQTRIVTPAQAGAYLEISRWIPAQGRDDIAACGNDCKPASKAIFS
jgi:hypothetical protein